MLVYFQRIQRVGSPTATMRMKPFGVPVLVVNVSRIVVTVVPPASTKSVRVTVEVFWFVALRRRLPGPGSESVVVVLKL